MSAMDDSPTCESSHSSIDTVINLFADWERVFGSKMRSNAEKQGSLRFDYRTAELWAAALTKLGMSHSMFRAAHERTLELEWPPTTPKDFYNLALEDVLAELPDMRRAYIDAANGKFDHGVCYAVMNFVGWWNLTNKSESTTYPKWKSAWHEVVERFAKGEAFELPDRNKTAIADKTKETAPKEVADAAIQKAMSSLGRNATA